MSSNLAKTQADRYSSPWSVRERAGFVLWHVAWCLLFRPSPKFLNAWRLFLLRCFGATVRGRPFVSQSAKIKIPWQLTLEDRACLGPHSEVYNLGLVRIDKEATVAQYVYLCGGTHDFDDPKKPLIVRDIVVGEDAFIGAKAIILPGVAIGKHAIVGAGAVVTRNVPEWTIVAGNPAKEIKKRQPPA